MSGPFEVESALIEHEAVLESAVVPRSLLWPFYLLFDFLLFISPDVERGQVVKAFVVLSDRFSEVSMSSLVKKKAFWQMSVIYLLGAWRSSQGEGPHQGVAGTSQFCHTDA